ncbi:hypothetical protein M011DRAFT_401325 [Sporormia fimetaria CBS 119925]|uniref:SET domain-containing protein n=1 Tax=Sporormia fimetaria CBS 119925 TaxID=1340428 RepID=A0A6A6VDA9_9PLEO|nr:hypothetical protein M011DRAFT_401325 [Sporormia fimetaria CBS 119925]
MSSFLCFCIVVATALLATAQSPLPLLTALTSQCWHESPFSTVALECATNVHSELVRPIQTVWTSSERATTKPRQYGPWTHKPVCSKPLQSLGTRLCVYTNSTFHGGRGISIVTTPKLAEQFAELPCFKEPSALQGINTFSGAWSVQETPGKGLGLVAKKQLKFKDAITAYTPALVALLEDELSTLDREKLYRIAVHQLPEATRYAYMNLAYIYGQLSVRVQDIVKANTFQLQVGGVNHLSVFPETSRLNHACGPNAQYYLDPARLTHFVHAVRPIAPGEEITIACTYRQHTMRLY